MVPFSMPIICVVYSSPLLVSTRSPVSLSLMPWPRAPKFPFKSTYVTVPIPWVSSRTQAPSLYCPSSVFTGLTLTSTCSPPRRTETTAGSPPALFTASIRSSLVFMGFPLNASM